MARYRITESRLRGMIREAVKSVLIENEIEDEYTEMHRFWIVRKDKPLAYNPLGIYGIWTSNHTDAMLFPTYEEAKKVADKLEDEYGVECMVMD